MEDADAVVIRHVLSFDVEHWSDGNLHRQWTAALPVDGDRLRREVDRVLDLLDRFATRATFFVVGRIGSDQPDVVRAIAARGHEIGLHAFEHLLLRECDPADYREGLMRGRAILQDLTGQPVLGHRAPSWSMDRRVPWAVAALIAAGFAYDSSIFPMRTPLYGEPGLPNTPFWLTAGGRERILELPPAVCRLGPLRVPYGGGLYWRVLPLGVIRMLLGSTRSAQVLYLHPWELNPEPMPLPRQLPWLERVYLGLARHRVQARLEGLLARFHFHSFRDMVDPLLRSSDLPTHSLAGDG